MKAEAMKATSCKHVRAVFPTHALSFDLPKEATLVDLADYLADVGESAEAKPIWIDIRFDS